MRGLEPAAFHSLWRDTQLWANGDRYWGEGRPAGGRTGEWGQPDGDRDPLPSSDPVGWDAVRVRRGALAEEAAPGVGAGCAGIDLDLVSSKEPGGRRGAPPPGPL